MAKFIFGGVKKEMLNRAMPRLLPSAAVRWWWLRSVCWVLVAAVLSTASIAAQPTGEPEPVPESSVVPSKVQERAFDPAKIDQYRNNRDFFYDRPKAAQTPWERFLKWLGDKLDQWLSDSDAGYAFDHYIRYVLYAIAIAMVVWLLWRVNVGALFFKRPRRTSISHELLDEDIHQLDFEQLIQQAIQEQNYRRAVRLHYLRTLKKLADNHIIDWQINKTNHHYQTELRQTPHATQFAQLTQLFDYVWYGEMPINPASFDQVQTQFIQFEQKI